MWTVVPTTVCTEQCSQYSNWVKGVTIWVRIPEGFPHDGPRGPKNVVDNDTCQLTASAVCWTHISYFTAYGKCGKRFHTWLAFGMGRHLTVMTAVSTAVTEFIRASGFTKMCKRRECPITNGGSNALPQPMWKGLVHVMAEEKKKKTFWRRNYFFFKF